MSQQNIGTVIQVIGPVLDIRFPDGQLPGLLNAITIENGDDVITLPEAAAVMDRILDVADVALDPMVEAQATWSTQAVANMVSVRVVSAGSFSPETAPGPVTRAQAAQILTAALDVLEEQEQSGGWFSWLW